MATRPQADVPSAPPADRYGKPPRRGRSRRQVWLLTAAGIIVGGVVAYVGYRNIGSAPIEAQRVAFAEQPGNAMSITVDVTRDEPGRPGVCIVRVRDVSGAESGRKEVYIGPADGGTRTSTVIKSVGRPVTADVFGCSYTVPTYLSHGPAS